MREPLLDFFSKISVFWENLEIYANLFDGFFICLAFGGLIVLSKSLHGAYSVDDRDGIQKIHTGRIPRVGGIAIFGAALISSITSQFDERDLLRNIIIAGMPCFFLGLLEDITKSVSVYKRLMATFISGALFWWLTSVVVKTVGIPIIGDILSIKILAVIFTVFALGGISNAFNLIDGANGLSSGTAVAALIAVTLVSVSVGDVNLARLSLLVSFLLLGFFLINYPWGFLFLGDGGAYLTGFVTGCFIICLIDRNPLVSPLFAILTLSYPLFDTVTAIFRRTATSTSWSKPDRRHLHSMLFTWLSYRLPKQPKIVAALVSPVIGTPIIASNLIAVLFWHRGSILLTMIIFVSILYTLGQFYLSRNLLRSFQ